ncbi:GNAT family N-acetyltransferase [Acidithiobacillus sulfuriphilus]|uniref:GNAT family N-acetyltransferase n=1 Tax=Acidithiobacillus sulfuriphilus TaxID=1867749 RepID=A0ACD5HUH7_9PROT|nr:GNAT family N-acetyltransferase [Acidithiobacillus sulfuriphilus]
MATQTFLGKGSLWSQVEASKSYPSVRFGNYSPSPRTHSSKPPVRRITSFLGWLFVYGRFVYVGDLVIDESCRSRGYGKILMERLKAEAKLLGCVRLLLDAAMSNTLGHRFYYRQGLLATALRFGMTLS